MAEMVKEGKKEKLVPVRCVCGRAGVTVRFGSKKMVSCADPMNCVGNLRTCWHSSIDNAIMEWNVLIMTKQV